jgi:homoisocitrate dehydrogenase
MLPLRRAFATASRSSLKIGLIPADGIGREVIPAARLAIEALGSSIPNPQFLDLDAGFEYFKKHGNALPEVTLQSAKLPSPACCPNLSVVERSKMNATAHCLAQ